MLVINKIGKIKNIKLSLSTKLILSMAGLVILSAVASLLISNMVINNQTRQLEDSVRRASTQIQEIRRQNVQPASTTIEQIRQILNNPDANDTPEALLGDVRRAMSNSDFVNGAAYLRIMRDSGFPVSEPGCFGPPPPGVSPGDVAVVIPRGANRGVTPALFSNNEKCTGSSVGAFYNYPVGQAIALGSLFSALCAVGLGFLLSRTIVRPVRALEQASQRIADGNYNHEIKLNGRDELAHLARSFNRMALALRQTEQKRKDLVADVSHELRTPLASIQGYSEVLRDGLAPSRERQEEILDHVLKEVKHLTSMVNSMREWVNNEQALEHLDVEVMPARYVADMVVERFRPTAAAKGIELELEVSKPEPQVRADADALSHALSNLVDNALRYTPEGGNVCVKIEQAKTTMLDKSPQVNFIVRDTGCGIAAEHLPFIFERFYRVDKSRDRNTGGSGLGLAIVRDTVQTLGGEVKIESTPGEGTSILFSLPAEPSAQPVRAKRKVAAFKAG